MCLRFVRVDRALTMAECDSNARSRFYELCRCRSGTIVHGYEASLRPVTRNAYPFWLSFGSLYAEVAGSREQFEVAENSLLYKTVTSGGTAPRVEAIEREHACGLRQIIAIQLRSENQNATQALGITGDILAVRVGFEPTEPVKVQRFSRPPDSTALAPHRAFPYATTTRLAIRSSNASSAGLRNNFAIKCHCGKKAPPL